VAVDAFITPFVAYFLARRFVINEYRFDQLVRVIGYMGVYVILFCLVERLTTLDMFYRLRGPFESANTLHPVLAVAFFVAWINPVYEGRQSLPNPIRWAILSIVPIVVGFTLTRGNWVGFLSALAIFLILARRLERFPRTAQKIGLILIIPLILGLSLANLIPENLLEERVMDGENILGRFATWIATLRIALTSPFFGVGLNNLYGLLSIDIVTYAGFENYSTPHNSLLSILAELGTVGVVVYVAALMAIVKMGVGLYRRGGRLQDRWRGVALVAIMVAYIMPSLFAQTMGIPGLIHIYVYVFAGAVAGRYSKTWAVSRGEKRHYYANAQKVRRRLEVEPLASFSRKHILQREN